MFSTRRSVLLVEDEQLLRELAEQALLRANHRVVSVGSAQEAREVWALGGWDVLVADYSLPDGVTGVELAVEFCAAQPSLAVVIMTGYDVETLKEDWGTPAQSMRFLQKPFRFDALVEAVEMTPERYGMEGSEHRRWETSRGAVEDSSGIMA